MRKQQDRLAAEQRSRVDRVRHDMEAAISWSTFQLLQHVQLSTRRPGMGHSGRRGVPGEVVNGFALMFEQGDTMGWTRHLDFEAELRQDVLAV